MKRMILKILKPQYFSTAAVVLCLVNIFYRSFWISTVINILLLITGIALVTNDMTTNSRIFHQWTKTKMENNKEHDDLEEFLNTANGEFTIKVNGMTPNVKGTGNKAGVIMAAFGMMGLVMNATGDSLEDVTKMFIDLKSVMNYEIIDRKSEGKNDNQL